MTHEDELVTLLRLVKDFLVSSAAPRSDGEHCDFCMMPVFEEHSPKCEWKKSRDALREFAIAKHKKQK